MRPGSYLIAGLALVALYVGLYLLPIAPSDRAPIAAVILPLSIAALAKAGIDSSNAAQAHEQGKVLATIQHQTNGVRASKIEDGVRKVLAERDAAQTVAVVGASSAAPQQPSPAPEQPEG